MSWGSGTGEAPGFVLILGCTLSHLALLACGENPSLVSAEAAWAHLAGPHCYPELHLILKSAVLIKFFPWNLGEFGCSPLLLLGDLWEHEGYPPGLSGPETA